jgi:hypothetical protein
MDIAMKIIKGHFIYHRIGHDHRPMTFLDDGTVGMGRAGCEMFWDLTQVGDDVLLTLSSEQELIGELEENVDKVWRGRWLCFEKMPVELTPIERGGDLPPKSCTQPSCGVVGIDYKRIQPGGHLIYYTPKNLEYRRMAIMLTKSLRKIGKYQGTIIIFTDVPSDFKDVIDANTQVVTLPDFSECPLVGRMLVGQYIRPDHFDQIMYLDCDILCTNSVEPFFCAYDCLMYAEEYFIKLGECRGNQRMEGINTHYMTPEECEV